MYYTFRILGRASRSAPLSSCPVLNPGTGLLPCYLPFLSISYFPRQLAIHFTVLEIMALAEENSTATALESPAAATRRSHVNLNGLSSLSKLQPLEPIRPRMKRKYRHVAAVHSMPRTSCLSHDSEVAPSFLGFRNLMVIVLSMSLKHSLFFK